MREATCFVALGGCLGEIFKRVFVHFAEKLMKVMLVTVLSLSSGNTFIIISVSN